MIKKKIKGSRSQFGPRVGVEQAERGLDPQVGVERAVIDRFAEVGFFDVF